MSDRMWAKKKEVDGILLWLPLTVHLQDTSHIIGQLWSCWLSDSQRQLILEAIDADAEEDGKNFVQFLAAVHDIGKATPAFQLKEGRPDLADLNSVLEERLKRAGFVDQSENTLEHMTETPHSLAGYVLLRHFGVKEDVASIIGAHHGSFNDNCPFQLVNRQLGGFETNYFLVEDKHSPVYQKWGRVQREIFERALRANGYRTADDLPTITQPGQVIADGLLIMADWIASNEEYFPLVDIETTKMDYSDERYQTGWKKWFKTWSWELQVVDIHECYNERFGFEEPMRSQEVFNQVIEETVDPGLFILEAPMGVGKTETALVGAEQLMNKVGASGLFFGLPTQATTDSMFSRVNDWLDNVSETSGQELSIRLSHGKAAWNDEFAEISSQNTDESVGGGVVTNQWFAGRKTSALDDFVIGTVDYFLMTALKQRHLMLRHLGFSKKVVIIDEVHSYDVFMGQYLNRALEWMGAYRVPVILLSATLPAAKRIEMARAYLSGQGLKKRDIEVPKAGLDGDDYPLITSTDGAAIKQKVVESSVEDEQEVSIKRLTDEEELDRVIEEAVTGGAVVGLIVNTVKRAQQLARNYAETFGPDRVDVLHSSFIATERVKKERELVQTIGKKAKKRPRGKIIIGTQVIEQSLDIDFDVMISDLAPMDLLIQRVGRLHRHSETKRPPGYEQPKLYVLGTAPDFDFDAGHLAVYGGYLLARTQYYLPDTLVLPTDISPLVQQVYRDDNKLELPNELEDIYHDFVEEYRRTLREKKHKARAFRVKEPKVKRRRKPATLINWTETSIKASSDEKLFAQVRDIDETIEVIALKEIGDGYGLVSEDHDLSERLSEAGVSRKIAKETLRLPIRYEIDRLIDELECYYCKKLNSWKEDPWLRGSLGIIFDEELTFEVMGYKLMYDEKYGLVCEKE